jgi:hypothetical protein
LSTQPSRHRPRRSLRARACAAHAARAPAAPQGTFWFRETTTLVAHQLEAVGEEDVAADDAEA